jgi:hypothetical protein
LSFRDFKHEDLPPVIKAVASAVVWEMDGLGTGMKHLLARQLTNPERAGRNRKRARKTLFLDFYVTTQTISDMKKTMEAVGKTAGSLSVVVPVYNSESILPKLLERLEPVLASLNCEFEVVLVNDASRDRSWSVIQERFIAGSGCEASN